MDFKNKDSKLELNNLSLKELQKNVKNLFIDQYFGRTLFAVPYSVGDGMRFDLYSIKKSEDLTENVDFHPNQTKYTGLLDNVCEYSKVLDISINKQNSEVVLMPIICEGEPIYRMGVEKSTLLNKLSSN